MDEVTPWKVLVLYTLNLSDHIKYIESKACHKTKLHIIPSCLKNKTIYTKSNVFVDLLND